MVKRFRVVLAKRKAKRAEVDDVARAVGCDKSTNALCAKSTRKPSTRRLPGIEVVEARKRTREFG